MITFTEIVTLMHSSIGQMSVKELMKVCHHLKMEQIEYNDFGLDSILPKFDIGHRFSLTSNENKDIFFEILEKEQQILQVGIVIHHFNNKPQQDATTDFNELTELLKLIYCKNIPLSPSIIDRLNPTEILYFEDLKTVCYLSKFAFKISYFVNLRFGNKRFWQGVL
jgi:hypothetical protein